RQPRRAGLAVAVRRQSREYPAARLVSRAGRLQGARLVDQAEGSARPPDCGICTACRALCGLDGPVRAAARMALGTVRPSTVRTVAVLSGRGRSLDADD